MRESKNRLEKFFDARMADLVEKDRDDNGHRKMKYELAQAEDERVGEGPPEFRIFKHRLKVLKGYPGAVPQAHVIAVFPKRQRNAAHGEVTKNDIPNEDGKQQSVEHPIISQLLLDFMPSGNVRLCGFIHAAVASFAEDPSSILYCFGLRFRYGEIT